MARLRAVQGVTRVSSPPPRREKSAAPTASGATGAGAST